MVRTLRRRGSSQVGGPRLRCNASDPIRLSTHHALPAWACGVCVDSNLDQALAPTLPLTASICVGLNEVDWADEQCETVGL